MAAPPQVPQPQLDELVQGLEQGGRERIELFLKQKLGSGGEADKADAEKPFSRARRTLSPGGVLLTPEEAREQHNWRDQEMRNEMTRREYERGHDGMLRRRADPQGYHR